MKAAGAFAAAMALALAAGVIGFQAGRHHDAIASPSAIAPQAASPAGGDRKVLYWHDPMVPGPRFDKPGKSPFMDMQLVPVYADAAPEAGVRIDAAAQQNLGLRTALVRRSDTSQAIDAVGSVQFDERLAVAVQTRVAGYVEHLAVRAPMERVRAGQALATVFAPDWLGPLNELLALERAQVEPDLVEAARARLRAMSVPDSLVRQSEKAGTAQARYTLAAPQSGVVTELGVREGAAVSPGTTLFRLAGLQKVWAVVDVPEAQAMRLRVGQPVKASLQADAGIAFDGTLAELLPQVDANTRTLRARFEVGNPSGRLVPGMLLRLRVDGPRIAALVVPSEAVIRTGRRAVAIVRKDGGAFQPRELTLGAELGDEVQVTGGLQEGERVVASGQFLIDSEARLRSATDRLTAPESAPAAAASGGAR